VWGRGALDDKAALVAILEAVESLLEEGFTPRRTVLIASGPDEEVGGFGGARRIAERVRDLGISPEYVLDEGLLVTDGILPGVRAPVALVGIAEKGIATVVLEVRGVAGHASMPPRRTAAGVLARAIARVEQSPFPSALGGAARGMLRALAPAVPPPARWVLARPGPLEPLVRALLGLAPETNALVRTTVAATVLEAGVKENVLPEWARATLDVRVLPGDSVEGAVRRIRAIVADDSVEVRLLPGASEPSPVSSTSSAAYRALVRAVARVHPDAVIAPSLVLAATDARHFRGLARDVYHFRPWRLAREDVGRIHGTDERIRIEDLGRGVEFFREVLRA
jgi:carboxypeptidase PM20D1